MKPENMLSDLNNAIDARIQREKDFIEQLVEEFRTCAEGVKTALDSAPTDVQQEASPYLTGIQEAINKLKNSPPLTIDTEIGKLVKYTHDPSNPNPNPPTESVGGWTPKRRQTSRSSRRSTRRYTRPKFTQKRGFLW